MGTLARADGFARESAEIVGAFGVAGPRYWAMLAAISGELRSSNQGGWDWRSAGGGAFFVGLGDGRGSGSFTFGSLVSADA